MASSEKTLFLTRFSILLALEAIVCFTPLGSIPLTPAIVATLMMVPVAVTAIVLGPGAGTAMGAFAGLFSLLVMSFVQVSPVSFVFTPLYSGSVWSLVVCFVPRILGGTFAGLVFRTLNKRATGAKKAVAYGVSGLVCSMTNTIGVLSFIYIFFGQPYAAVNEVAYELLLGVLGLVVLTNGVPEAIVCTIAASVICQPLRKLSVRKAVS